MVTSLNEVSSSEGPVNYKNTRFPFSFPYISTVYPIPSPQFILMLIFSCILDKGYDSTGVCLYNGNQGACNFTVGIAVIAFFVGLAFIAVTYFWDEITNIVTR